MGRNSKKDKRIKYSKGEGGSSAMRVIVVLFFLILFVVGASMFFNQKSALDRVTTRSESLAEKEAAASIENEEAKALMKKVGTDTFTEEMARNELGMVMPGETVYETQN